MSERFRQAREAAGLSYSWAAELTGIGRTTLYELERGAQPSLEKAAAMAVAYGVTLDWLAGLSDDGGPEPAEE